jgi:hypothetical protein
MSILRTYLFGLAVAHLAWFYFFTTGHLLRRRTSDQAYSLDELVITSVAGMAIAGFGLVFLGFTHFLNVFWNLNPALGGRLPVLVARPWQLALVRFLANDA